MWKVSFEYSYDDDDVADEAEAAIAAFNTITEPSSMMPIATVTRPDGTVVEHDLAGEETNG